MPLLIPGFTSSGNDIDVYLYPLIDELKELETKGVNSYNGHIGDALCMRAVFLWSTSDCLAYVMLPGWSMKD